MLETAFKSETNVCFLSNDNTYASLFNESSTLKKSKTDIIRVTPTMSKNKVLKPIFTNKFNKITQERK